jgi:uncharacterized protein (TIGR03435 family)
MRASDERDQDIRTRATRSGGPGTSDPRLIRFSATTMENILAEAFDVSWNRISGPDWIETQRYDIAARVPDQTTKEQADEMIRNLLVERVHLKYHVQAKSSEGYELVRTSTDERFQKSKAHPADAESDDTSDAFRLGDDGFPVLPRGANQSVGFLAGKTSARFREISMAELARWLGQQLGQEFVPHGAGKRLAPVAIVDKTGLTERYDLTFEYRGIVFLSLAPDGARRNLTAVQSSLEKLLGLKLVSAKVTVNNLIIDHVDRMPAAN